jgi:hypothetical protein
VTIVESKLYHGKLVLGGTEPGVGGTDFSCQPSNVTITASASTSGDDIETLCGDKLLAETTLAWELDFTAIQDWSDPEGLVKYSWDMALETVYFLWVPNDTETVQISGEVQVQPLDLGGDVNTRITSDAAWPIAGKPDWGTHTPAGAATGAMAGTPGAFTPAGATVPATLAALTAAAPPVVASPATVWPTSTYVDLADASKAHWSGSAWVTGIAP